MAANYIQLTNKLTLILWPYLRLTILFLSGYGLLDGTLLNWLPRFDPSNGFWTLLGPGVFAAALVLWLLWPRLHLLGKNQGEDKLPILLGMIAMLVMASGANSLHNYLRATLGRLEVLDSPATLTASHSLGTYYRFRRRYQTPRIAGIESQTITSDKGRNLVFHLYVATPLFASAADTKRPPAIWQGLHYSAQVSNQASHAQKEASYRAFYSMFQLSLAKRDLLLHLTTTNAFPTPTSVRLTCEQPAARVYTYQIQLTLYCSYSLPKCQLWLSSVAP